MAKKTKSTQTASSSNGQTSRPQNISRLSHSSVDAAIAMQFGRATWDRHVAKTNLIILVLSVSALVASCFVTVFALNRPAPTRFIYADTNGNIRPLIAENLPNMSDADAAGWLASALSKSFSFSYVDFKNVVMGARQYFTDANSFNQYCEQLTKSGIINLVQQESYVLESTITQAPYLDNAGVLGGHYTWHFIVPMELTFHSENSQHDRKMSFKMSVSVARIGESFSSTGLGISTFFYEGE